MRTWADWAAPILAGSLVGWLLYFGVRGARRLLDLRAERRCHVQIARKAARLDHPSVVGRGPGPRH